MLLQRMAYKLFLLCLTLWTTLLTFANAQQQQTKNVTSEILNFVPQCAQECFRSFITANFDARICGNSPSLQCLCRQTGLSGYTVGEGAVSCIIGESQLGSCQGRDSTSDTTTTAYNMCVGVSKAAPRTHETLTATLIRPTGTGGLIVPTPSPTRSVTGTETTTTTTTTTAISTTTFATRTRPPVATATDPTETEISPSTSTAAPAVADAQPTLSTGQIVGIAVGCAAMVLLGIGLIFLGRCIRRRRYGHLEGGDSEFAKMKESPNNGRASAFPGPQISSPLARIPAQRNPNDPRWNLTPTASNTNSERRFPGVGVGLNASLFANATMVPAPKTVRTASPKAQLQAQNSIPKVVLSPPAPIQPQPQGSPPKPTLTLAIPRPQERMYNRVPANRTDSVVTEFAEDGEVETAKTAKASVWRPPPSDPQSATAMYFADKGGNWVLRSTLPQGSEQRQDQRSEQRQQQRSEPSVNKNKAVPPLPKPQGDSVALAQAELPSPEHKTRAERAKDAYLMFSPNALVSPLRIPSKESAKMLGSPIAFKDQRREPQVSRQNPANRSSQTAETLTSSPELDRKQGKAPDSYFDMVREGRELTGGRNKGRSMRRANRRNSQEAPGTPDRSPYEDDAIIEDEAQIDLSPVAESPNTPISPGKSPVTYPKIRKRTEATQPPPIPERADRNSRGSRGSDLLPRGHQYNVWHPGHSKPAEGSVQPMRNPTAPQGPTRPTYGASLNPMPIRNPGQMRTGSPDTRGVTIEDQYFRSQKRLSNPASYWGGSSQPRPAQQTRPQYDTPPQQQQQRPYPQPQQQQRQQPYLQPQQQQRRPQQPQQYSQAPPYTQPPYPQQYASIQNQQQYKPYIPLPNPAPYPSPAPTQSQTPIASAVAMSGPGSGLGTNSAHSSQSSLLLAKRRGPDRAAALTLANANDSYQRKAARTQWQRADPGTSEDMPPITPGWVPELTPTRRGDDLFLNVR